MPNFVLGTFGCVSDSLQKFTFVAKTILRKNYIDTEQLSRSFFEVNSFLNFNRKSHWTKVSSIKSWWRCTLDLFRAWVAKIESKIEAKIELKQKMVFL